MHHMDIPKILARHPDPNFLGGLADHSRDDVLILFQVTRHEVQEPIRISGVRTPSQQQPTAVDQHEMDVNDAAVTLAHNHSRPGKPKSTLPIPTPDLLNRH
jgi:hypothetical protein